MCVLEIYGKTMENMSQILHASWLYTCEYVCVCTVCVCNSSPPTLYAYN